MNYDATDIAETYDRGRDHGPAFLEQWMNVVAARVNPQRIRRIVDLGCGTGRFAQGLAERFDTDVIGIDPSRKMLAQAQNKTGNRVSYISAFAETLPLRSNAADFIFASMVYHHFEDAKAVARECERVLRPHGRVLVRTGTSEQISNYPYVPFFPSTPAILERLLPSVAAIRTAFESASFRTLAADIVVQQIAADYGEYAEKLSFGADSVLASLDPKEFTAGLEALRAKHAASGPHAVVEPIDLIVFEKYNQRMRLVEEISGVGQLMLHGHALGDTPYRISRYQGFLEANGLPIPGLHRIEGVVELHSVTVPPEWIGIPLTLKLQDGRTFGITLLDSDGRILSEGHGPTKCLCC